MESVSFLLSKVQLSLFLFGPSSQPHVDFGLKVLGADAMSIPGLYRVVQVCKIGCLCDCL